MKELIRNHGGSLRTPLALLVAGLVAAVAAGPAPAEQLGASTVRTAAALSAQAPASAYGWPVKPFRQQHPVRGFFGDPRVGLSDGGVTVEQFHFGIDISAPNGTPVYATLTGTASIHPLHPDVVLIVSGSREFSYWHIVPAIRAGTHAVAYRTLIGHVEQPWAHVHFSERANGVYLNPLRPGALGPYRDTTRPTIHAICFEHDGVGVGRETAGRLDIVAEVFDETPLPVAAPWAGKPVMPAVVRWRLSGPEVAASGWQTAVDFRQTIPPASLYGSVYAKWTRQNHASVIGRYRVYLIRALDTATLADGHYAIEVVAADAQGNSTHAVAPFTVRNHETGDDTDARA